MVSSRLLNVLDVFGPKLIEKTSVERCDYLLSALPKEFDIKVLNPSGYRHISQCKSNSKEEQDGFKLFQDVIMTEEILNHFKESRDFQLGSRCTYELSADINQSFSIIQKKVFSIVFNDRTMK